MKLSTLLLAVTLSLPTSALAGPLADPPAYQLEQDFQKALTLATAFHHATHRQIRAMVAQKLTGDPARDAARIHKLVEGYIVNLAAIGHHEAILVNDIDPPCPATSPSPQPTPVIGRCWRSSSGACCPPPSRWTGGHGTKAPPAASIPAPSPCAGRTLNNDAKPASRRV